MRKCDTCGSLIEEAHPYRVCAKCLFEDALNASDDADSAVGEPAGEELREKFVVHHLIPREDFFRKYDIIERLGGGGQGEVWKVWDFEFCRTLAMKRLSEKALASEPARYRFLAEAQIASQLEHPGILPIFDMGLDPDGRPYYTTQLLPGTTLNDIWRKVRDPGERDWTISRALGLLARVCEIMAHAHSRGVIHRDLKPTNVLVGPFGDVRVIDWGSAHVLDSACDDFEESFVKLNQPVIVTDRGEVLWARESPLSTAQSGQPVTILFVRPEILAGQSSQVDPQTDIYSMGVMLYGLLAGRFPYSQPDGTLPDPPQLGKLILAAPPTPLRSLNPSISRDLDAICGKAMSRSKTNRYSTMLECAEDIRASLELRPVKARRPGPLLKAKRFIQRHAGYVSLVCMIAVVVAVGWAIVGRLRRERDVARQVQALRDAELAARNGHWRDVLRHLDAAQSAGYSDAIDLGLQRAQAWTVLNQPDRAGAELRKLMRRSDLGSRRGTVLLNVGDYELFDKTTAAQGEAHVREALAAGLGRADQSVAEGLLADSVPKALSLFQQALRIDPYSYAAHIHSLGMEFVLGHHAELAAHIHIFEILYPDDPSPRYLEASELALSSQPQEASRVLEPLRQTMAAASWDHLILGHQRLAEAAQCFSIAGFLRGDAFDSRKLDQLMSESGFLLAASLPESTTSQPTLREPHLPCLEHGLLDGVAAVQALSSPFYRDITPAIEQIKSSWRLCPVAVLPFRAAMLLEARQPTAGPKSIPLLVIQAELFQMAADSPSFVPSVPRTSRHMAAKAELQLIQSLATNLVGLRKDCLRNLRAAAAAGETSPLECRAYFTMACALGDYDAAKQLLDRWEAAAPGDSDLQRDHVELNILSGNFESAVRLIDGLLARDAADAWALRQRRAVIGKLEDLLGRIRSQRDEIKPIVK